MAETDLLPTFQKHIEDMRSLALCKICIKPFYEPFILSCGHTYCYSCLASWFGGGHGRKSKKSCPDCRARVRVQPSPNYLLRDLVHMFIGRAELLPEDETVQEHEQAKEEEAVLLAADRAGSGLFKGVFAEPAGPLYFQRQWGHGFHDPEDNVVRCPECHWELEDGQCHRCGFHEFDFSDSEEDSAMDDSIDLDESEMDDDDDELDPDFEASMGGTGFQFHIPDPTSRIPTFYSDEDDDDEDDSEMDQFIDDDGDDNTSDAGTASTMTMYNRQFPRDPHTEPSIQISSGSPAASDEDETPRRASHDRYNDYYSDAETNYDETSEASDPDDAPVHSGRQSRPMRVILSSEDEDEGDMGNDGANDEEQEEDEEGDVQPSATQSSINHSGSEDEDSDDSVRPPTSSQRRLLHLGVPLARRAGNHNVRTRPGPLSRNQPDPAPPLRQSSYRGRPGTRSRFEPYQRPASRRVAVGGSRR
jgi:hypothetical protein